MSLPLSTYLSLLLCVVTPLFTRAMARRGWLPDGLSPIILCYLTGILVSNLRLWPVQQTVGEAIAGGSMLLGLPLLLFAVRIQESWQHARRMLLAFSLCCLAGLICTGITGVLMATQVTDSWKVAGMLTGLYTGGTPNVQAIGLALAAPPGYLVLIQAADVLLGGSYLLGLITFLPRLYARWFTESTVTASERPETFTVSALPLRQQFPQFLAGASITLAALGMTWLITGGLDNLTWIILLLTTGGLLAGATPRVQRLGNTYPLGEYFILVFCVALGLLADFRVLADQGMELLYFSAIALGSLTIGHLLLCKWFRIDRDTVILSYVAACYGPVFVVQVAAALKNRQLLAAGIAASLLGFGIGNYLGIGLAFVVRWLTGFTG